MEEVKASAPLAPFEDWIEVEAECAPSSSQKNRKKVYAAVAIAGAVATACIVPQLMMKGATLVLIMPRININNSKRHNH